MHSDLTACIEPGDIHSYENSLPLSHTCTLSHLSALVWQSKDVPKKLLRSSCSIIWIISCERFISIILLQVQRVTSAWTASCLPYSISKTNKMELRSFMTSLFCSCSVFSTWAQNLSTSSNEKHALELWKLHVFHSRDPNKKNGCGKLLQTASQPLFLICCIMLHSTTNYALKNKFALPARQCQHLSCPALPF